MQRIREVLPYALLGVIELWWLYTLLGVIDLWWLYGWHVGVTALVAVCVIAWFTLYARRSRDAVMTADRRMALAPNHAARNRR